MDKSPDAFRTISEVAEWLDVPTHVLRFWESRFTQVKPVKRAGGRRYYRPSDMALLGGIKKLLHEDGLTIRGVQKVLREQGVKHVAALVPSPGGETVETAAQPAMKVIQDVPAPAGLEVPSEDPAEAERVDAAPPAEPASAQAPEDPDAALRRFPFVDDEPEDTPAPEETVAPEAEAEAEEEPAVVAFDADVPQSDPEDDDQSIAVPGDLVALVLPGAATRLAAHSESLGALYDRACALRDRMSSRAGAE